MLLELGAIDPMVNTLVMIFAIKGIAEPIHRSHHATLATLESHAACIVQSLAQLLAQTASELLGWSCFLVT